MRIPLILFLWCASTQLAWASDHDNTAPRGEDLLDKIEDTRAKISQDEKVQREALSRLFIINKKVKDIARRQEQLNQKMLTHEGEVRALAQEVQTLEVRKESQKESLNRRLRQLYQERDLTGFHWAFAAQSPVELERNHRFLRRMIDSDHRQLKTYLGSLAELKQKRLSLKSAVARLAAIQKQVSAQEQELTAQMQEKSHYLSEIKKSKDLKLSQLKSIRSQHGELDDLISYAFFERKGSFRLPVEAPLARDYGTYVDPQFHFKLTHKGLFYKTSAREFRAISSGRVSFAGPLPGFGRAVIVDHGDNYYSVYAFASKIKVQEGSLVKEGEPLGLSGEVSPLFGPGLYFEIRHFTDAIDPRPWFKESLIKTADSRDGDSL